MRGTTNIQRAPNIQCTTKMYAALIIKNSDGVASENKVVSPLDELKVLIFCIFNLI